MALDSNYLPRRGRDPRNEEPVATLSFWLRMAAIPARLLCKSLRSGSHICAVNGSIDSKISYRSRVSPAYRNDEQFAAAWVARLVKYMALAGVAEAVFPELVAGPGAAVLARLAAGAGQPVADLSDPAASALAALAMGGGVVQKDAAYYFFILCRESAPIE